MSREARSLAGEAAAAFARQDMPMDANLARLVEARGWLAANLPAPAIPIMDEAAHFFRRHRPRRAAIELLQARAALLSANAGQAVARSQRALRAFRALGMLKSAAGAHRLAAEAHLALGQPSRAEKILAPVLRACQTLPVAEQFELAWLAGRIARARGRGPEAIRHLEQAVTHLEARQVSIPGVELRARAFEQGVRAYHDLFALLIEQPAPRMERLFAVTQSARARGFRERSQLRQRGLPARLAQERVRLGSLVRQLEAAEYPERGVPDPATISRLQRKVRTLERRITEPILRAEPGRRATGLARGAIAPARIGRALAHDEALVEYFIAGGRATAFVIRPASSQWRVLPVGEDDLRERVDRVRFHIAAMSLAPAVEPDLAFHRQTAEVALAALHDALLRPLADLLPAEGRLIVIPHRFLHHVPFECLWDGAAYIDARYRITRLPTSTLLLRRAEKGVRRGHGVAVCGGAQASLAAVDQELDAVHACFEAGSATIQRACCTADLLAALETSRVFHISAHGAFRADNPLFSRIGTADGALFLADLLGVRTAAELVVLSACDSGLAFTGNGDDLAGVAHGFLAAGARRLVASLWRIHDRATRDLMSAFYRHYIGEAHGDAAHALALAGRDARATWNHPFYWGSFCVHGV
jgi:tetratricopeptide (TPR) repeat protein